MRISERTVLPCFTAILLMMLAVPTAASAQGGQSSTIQARLDAIVAQLEKQSAQLDEVSELAAAAVHDVYVPFKVEIPGGMCDSGGLGTSNPSIVIDSDGADTFLVTSILVKRGFMNPVDFGFFSVNTVAIDGTSFDTRTGNLFDPIGGESGVLQSADILGMPVRRSVETTDEFGGNVPHQIVANGGDVSDISVQFFCASDNQDMTLEKVLVAGWKRPSDTITVTYVPGS